MPASKWVMGCAAAVAAFVPVPEAQAQILLYEVQGTVDSISDATGVLGSPAAGSSFALVYRADFSVGWRSVGAGGGGGGGFLRGGTSELPDPNLPTATLSPVSAVLTINGRQLDFSGEYFGNVEYAYNLLGEIFGSGPPVSWAILDAQAGLRPDGSLTSSVGTRLDALTSASTFGALVDRHPMSVAVDGTLVTGSTSFSYVWGAGTPQETLISGTMTPLTYSVTEAAPVPEPSQWLLLALGLSALPALGRRRH